MQILSRKSFAGLVAACLTIACVGFASWGSHKSADRKTDVTFTSTARFNNGDTIPAGTYRMEVAQDSQTPTVTFSKNGKVIATEKAQVVTEQKKNSSTEIDSDTQGNVELVKTIRPAGWEEALDFGSTAQSANGAQ